MKASTIVRTVSRSSARTSTPFAFATSSRSGPGNESGIATSRRLSPSPLVGEAGWGDDFPSVRMDENSITHVERSRIGTQRLLLRRRGLRSGRRRNAGRIVHAAGRRRRLFRRRLLFDLPLKDRLLALDQRPLAFDDKGDQQARRKKYDRRHRRRLPQRRQRPAAEHRLGRASTQQDRKNT